MDELRMLTDEELEEEINKMLEEAFQELEENNKKAE